MENPYTSGGNWTMIPNIPSHSNSPAHSNPDPQQFYLSPQQQQQFTPPQQQQFTPPPQQQFTPPQHFQQPPQFQQQQFTPPQQQQQQQHFPPQQQQRFIQPQQMQQPQLTQSQHHPSLASHFHLLHLVENLADAIENGSRDHQSDALVAELSSQFEKCQQLLNSIASSIGNKNMTVEAQKQKLEESEQLLNQRRELIAKYRNSVEELTKSEQ